MSEIQAGEGWRLLGPDEVVKFADEYLSKATGCWHPMTKDLYGWKANCFIAVRRRIPAKPEAMEIGGYRVSLENGYVRIVDEFSHYKFFGRPKSLCESSQIRQLSQWLQQVAEWREAQESK